MHRLPRLHLACLFEAIFAEETLRGGDAPPDLEAYVAIDAAWFEMAKV